MTLRRAAALLPPIALAALWAGVATFRSRPGPVAERGR